MATAIEREIKFLIRVKNEFSQGIGQFKGEISAIKKEVDSLNKLSSSDKGFKQTRKNISDFMKEVSKIEKTKYFKQFERIAESFKKIGDGAQYAVGSLGNITKIFEKVAGAGSLIGKNKKDIDTAMGSFKSLANTIAVLSKAKLDNLATMGTSFKYLSEALGKIAGGQVNTAITTVAEAQHPLQKVALALKSIVRSLSSDKVLTGAQAIARIGGGFIGGGGKAGPPGGVDWNRASLSTVRTFEKGFEQVSGSSSKIDPTKLAIGEKVAAEEFVANMKEGEFHPSALGKLHSGKTFVERYSKEFGTMSAARGQMVHAFQEFVLRDKETGEGIGEFLKRKGHRDKAFIENLKREGKVAKGLFKGIAYDVATEKGITVDPQLKRQINAAANRVEIEIRQWAHPKTGFFGSLYSQISRNVGGQSDKLKQALSAMTVQVEKELGPLLVFKPGFKVASGVPKQVLKETASHLKLLKKNLSTESYAKLVQHIKSYGWKIKGTADVVANFKGMMDKMIIDLKTGVHMKGDMPYTVAQQSAYQALEEQTGSGRAGSYTYTPSRRVGLEASGRDVAGFGKILAAGSDVDDSLEALKRQEAAYEKILGTKEQIIKNEKEKVRVAKEDLIYQERLLKLANELIALGPEGGGRGGRGGKGGGVLPPIDGGDGGFGGGAYGLSERSKLLFTKGEDIEKDFEDKTLAMSKYTQSLTTAYIQQQMMGQGIDLTKVKMSEYNRVVNSLSNSFAKYVTITETGGNVHTKTIAYFERLQQELDYYSKGLDQASSKEKQRARIASEVREAVKAKGSGAGEDILKIAEPTAFMARVEGHIGEGRETWESIKKKSDKYKELGTQIKSLEGAYKRFNEQLTTAMGGQSSGNAVLDKTFAAMKRLDPEFGKQAAAVESVDQAVRLWNTSLANLHRTELVGAVSEQKVSATIEKVRQSFKAVKLDADNYNQSAGRLASGLQALQAGQSKYADKLKIVSQATSMAREKLASLTAEQRKNTTVVTKLNKEIDFLVKQYDRLSMEIEDVTTKTGKVQEIQRRQAGKTAEHFRGTIRTTLKGFGDMMKSQAAWIAGYGAMFGILRGFKTALGSVVTIEHEFARAMRTSRSEMLTNLEIAKQYRTEGVGAMIEFGKTAGEVGEVLYQLGSAGLTSQESLAALDSTMKMLVGTEGDVTDSTKMVAAIYNNFSEKIVGAISLQEKFKYINDIVVATFRDHQVELNELREGYKHLMAMGKVANITFLEMSATLATLNDHLIKSGIAGRSVQTTLSKISKQPYEFAKAFNISIDPDKPMNFIKIIRDIAKQFTDQGMTVKDVGTIFERLGLRGAKAFVTLIQNVDDLDENIKSLALTSEGAADDMARVMLEKPDVAFARMRETLASVVRLGFEPLVKAAHLSAVAIASSGNVFADVHPKALAVGKAIGNIVGTMSALMIASAGFSTIWKRLDIKHHKTSDWATLSLLTKNIKENFVNMGKSLGILFSAGFTGKWAKMAKAFTALSFALKAAIVVAALWASYKIWDWLVITGEEYAAIAGKSADFVSASLDEISAIREKAAALKEATEAQQLYSRTLEGQAKVKFTDFLEKFPKEISNITLAAQKQLEVRERVLEREKQGIEVQRQSLQLIEALASSEVEMFDPEATTMIMPIKREGEDLRQHYNVIVKIANAIEKVYERIDKLNLGEKFAATTLLIRANLSDYHNRIKDLLKEYEKELGKDYEPIQAANDKAGKALSRAVEGSWDKLLKEERAAAARGPIEILKLKRDEIEREIASRAKTSEKTLIDMKNRGADVKLGGKHIKNEEALGKLVGERAAVEVKIDEAIRQENKAVEAMAKKYRDLTTTLVRGVADITKPLGGLGVFSKVFNIDDVDSRKVEDFQNKIDDIMESISQMKLDRLTAFLKKIDVGTKDEAKTFFEEKAKQYKDLAKVRSDFLKSQAEVNYEKEMTNLRDIHSDSIADLSSKMKEYTSVEEKIGEAKRTNSKEQREYTKQIDDLNERLKTTKHDMENVTFTTVEQISVLLKQQETLKLKIKNLEELKNKTKELNKEELRRLEIQLKINKEEQKQAFYQKTYQDMVSSGQSGSNVIGILRSSLDARHSLELQAQTKMYDQLRANAKENGEDMIAIEKLIGEASVALYQRQTQEKLYVELEYNRAILEAKQDLANKEGELAMRNAKTLDDYAKASVLSMKAGFIQFDQENENLFEHIKEISHTTMDSVAGTMSSMISMWVERTAEGSEDYKKLMHDMLTSVGRELIAYSTKLIFIIALKKIAGMLGNTGDIGIDAGAASASSMGFTGVGGASGGLLHGGIPGKDSIPVLGMQGEYLLPKDSVDYYGLSLLERLRKKDIKKMEYGGVVTSSASASRSEPSTRQGDTINNVTVKTNDVQSFRQYLYENRDLISGMVLEDMNESGVNRRR